MITVIKNINVYAPKALGKKNVVIAGDKFEGVYDELSIPDDFININIIDGSGKIMLPGFIDAHIHLIGGGGEGGFTTRTPELRFTDISSAGITTVVGCLGTDNVCRERLEKTIILFTKVVSFLLILSMFSQMKYAYSNLLRKMMFLKVYTFTLVLKSLFSYYFIGKL